MHNKRKMVGAGLTLSEVGLIYPALPGVWLKTGYEHEQVDRLGCGGFAVSGHCRVQTGRCELRGRRVSYLGHDGAQPD